LGYTASISRDQLEAGRGKGKKPARAAQCDAVGLRCAQELTQHGAGGRRNDQALVVAEVIGGDADAQQRNAVGGDGEEFVAVVLQVDAAEVTAGLLAAGGRNDAVRRWGAWLLCGLMDRSRRPS
jgi:hypothetical protein